MNEYNADIHRIMKLSRALTKSCKDWIVAILISINLLGFDPANVLSLLGYLQINRQSKAIRCNFAHWRFTVYVLSCKQPYNQLLLRYQQNESIFLSRVGDPMSRVENWGQYFFWVFFFLQMSQIVGVVNWTLANPVFHGHSVHLHVHLLCLKIKAIIW